MRKILLSCGLAGLLLSSTDTSAQLALQNFNAPAIPAGWLLYNQDMLTPATQTAWATQAWNIRTRTTGDSCIGSTSWYNPAGTANDWIVSPQFTVNGTGVFLS